MLDWLKELAINMTSNIKCNRENSPNIKAIGKKRGAATTGNNSPIYQGSVTNNYNFKVRDGDSALEIIRATKLEAENNLVPGTGDSKCRFEVNALKALVTTSKLDLPEDIKRLVTEIIQKAHICNSDRRSSNCNPNIVKRKCRELISKLEAIEANLSD